ncbi:uncharacterized protein [Bemisia tabaci]|uniref:uncharacterized protein n=1 Tax=Bemisia tabaci TaxID=7038 RepID=UPI003B285A27
MNCGFLFSKKQKQDGKITSFFAKFAKKQLSDTGETSNSSQEKESSQIIGSNKNQEKGSDTVQDK